MGTLGSRGSAPHRSLSQQHGGCQHGGHQHGGRCHGGATPAACRPHSSRLGPGTHSPSPTSASLQTSVVTVSSPSMPVAAGKQREGSAAMGAVACRHCLSPLGRQSSPCTLVPSLQNPTPKCRAAAAPAGSRSAPSGPKLPVQQEK